MSEWLPLPDVPERIDELVIDDLDLIAELTHPTRSALIHRLRTPHSAAELDDPSQPLIEFSCRLSQTR